MVSVLRASNFSVWELHYFLIIKHYYPPPLFYNQGSKDQSTGEVGLDPKPRFKSHSPGGGGWGLGEAGEMHSL